jgi:hypothetical protein
MNGLNCQIGNPSPGKKSGFSYIFFLWLHVCGPNVLSKPSLVQPNRDKIAVSNCELSEHSSPKGVPGQIYPNKLVLLGKASLRASMNIAVAKSYTFCGEIRHDLACMQLHHWVGAKFISVVTAILITTTSTLATETSKRADRLLSSPDLHLSIPSLSSRVYYINNKPV